MVRQRLKLVNGDEALTVLVQFDSGAHVEQFYRRVANVLLAERAISGDTTGRAADEYGAAIMALYRLILGNDADRVEAFFGPNVLSMVQQVNTFITRYVQGDVDNCSARNRRRMQKQFLRQQRRAHREAH